MTDEIWNLNKHSYYAVYGEANNFGLRVQGAFFTRYHFVASIYNPSNRQFISSFDIRFNGSPTWFGDEMLESHFHAIAVNRVKRFLIGDRKGWRDLGNSIFMQEIPSDQCQQPESFQISQDNPMQIEWSQVIAGKKGNETYITSVAGLRR